MPDLLRSFAAGGFALQAAPARAALGLAALAALSGGNAPAPELSGGRATLAPQTYSRLVAAMQDRADAELGEGRVAILDRTTEPGDVMRRLTERLSAAGATRGLARFDEDGPAVWARPYEVPPGTVCVVAGPEVGATVEEVAGPDAADAGVTALEAYRHALWKQVGDCILPNAPAAEAFAALAAARRGDGGRMARVMAERPADADGPDEAVQGTLDRVARLAGSGADLSRKGWGNLAAMALALAAPSVRAPARGPEPSTTASVAAPGAAPVPARAAPPKR